MAERKYAYYSVAFDDELDCETENYREAFGIFQRHSGSATLYGNTAQGDIETILSK